MLFRSNDTATTEIYTACYTLSLHDALPISAARLLGGLLDRCRRAERGRRSRLRAAFRARRHHVGARRRGAGDTHQHKRDLGRAFHSQMLIDAALIRPAVIDAQPSQIAGPSSPAAIRCERSGRGMRARK